VNILCIDDEPLVLNLMMSQCKELVQKPSVCGFTLADEALGWLRYHDADICLLDIDMPDMDGLVLANKIRELRPSASIIYITAYDSFAVDAFAQHVSGYLLKPVSQERLQAEIDHAIRTSLGKAALASFPRVEIHTFGAFDVLVDGAVVTFNRTKAKELLAYLVDRQGGVTRAEAFSILWNDGAYDRRMQKQLDVVIRSLRSTLDRHGVGDIVRLDAGKLSLRTELVSCDLYRFLAGDADAVRSFRGEYLSQYDWACESEGRLDLIWQRNAH
jgi:two-component SAPR family response regulator